MSECAVPATLTNKAALLGKPAYYHQSDKKPFLPEQRLHTGIGKLGLFVELVADKKTLGQVTKAELGLEAKEDAAEIMANRLLN